MDKIITTVISDVEVRTTEAVELQVLETLSLGSPWLNEE